MVRGNKGFLISPEKDTSYYWGFTDAVPTGPHTFMPELLSPWLWIAGWLKLFWAFLQVSLATQNSWVRSWQIHLQNAAPENA